MFSNSQLKVTDSLNNLSKVNSSNSLVRLAPATSKSKLLTVDDIRIKISEDQLQELRNIMLKKFELVRNFNRAYVNDS